MHNMYGNYPGGMGYMPQQWGQPVFHPGMHHPMAGSVMPDDGMMDAEEMPPFMSEFGDDVEFVGDFDDMMGMGGGPGFYGAGPMPMGPMSGGPPGPTQMMGDDPMFDDPTFMPTMDDHDMMGMEEPMMGDNMGTMGVSGPGAMGGPMPMAGPPMPMMPGPGPMHGAPASNMPAQGQTLKTKKFTRNK